MGTCLFTQASTCSPSKSSLSADSAGLCAISPGDKLCTNLQGVEHGGQCRVEARGLSDMQGEQITCWGKASWTRDI